MNENIQETQQFKTMREDSFMKKLLKKRLNQKGLTLIELLAVIVILAIVAAIAIPAIGGIIENSRIKAAKSDAIMILNAASLYDTENDANIGSTGVTLPANYVDSLGGFAAPGSYTVSDNGTNLIFNGTWTNGTLALKFNAVPLSGIDSSSASLASSDTAGAISKTSVPTAP